MSPNLSKHVPLPRIVHHLQKSLFIYNLNQLHGWADLKLGFLCLGIHEPNIMNK